MINFARFFPCNDLFARASSTFGVKFIGTSIGFGRGNSAFLADTLLLVLIGVSIFLNFVGGGLTYSKSMLTKGKGCYRSTVIHTCTYTIIGLLLSSE